MEKTKVKLKANAVEHNTGNEYRFALEFYVFLQQGRYKAYCPSLDLSSSADSFNEAISNFYEAFQLYVETGIEMGTLRQDLAEHGCTIKEGSVLPPPYTVIFQKQEMKDLLRSETSYERMVTLARIPAFA